VDDHEGRTTYTSYLLTHPGSDLSGPFDDRRRFLRPAVGPYATAYHVDPGPAAGVVGAVAMPESRAGVEIWIGLAALAAVVLVRRRRDRALLVTAGLSAVICVVHFLVAWHGDALELDRHIIAAAVELRIVLWIVTALALDELLSSRTRGAR
jgi:MYXO-CTERM domain-containing protein